MQNNTKDRLINLIQNAVDGCAKNWAEVIADCLLENGVIVPPCKVGDVVYCITECSCEDIDGQYTVCGFYGCGTDDMVCTIPDGVKCPYQYRIGERRVTKWDIFDVEEFWGKTIFFTRAEAERALRESEKIKDD
ncbi:MAG: hypothetical protein IJ045_07090 [Ruminiclostridium sp.]|nr:hypothetical protein [Ruminiclostridium sp.]